MRSRERAESVIVIFSPSSVPSVLDIIGFFLNLSCSGIDGGRRSVRYEKRKQLQTMFSNVKSQLNLIFWIINAFV